WSRAGGLLIISGAFGIFRKDVLLEVGGLATDCIGEDAELVVRIHRLIGDQKRDASVVFVPEPVAWTEVPEDRAVLRKQRRRWHRGLTEIMVRHRAMFFRPRYGVIGMLTMPWFFCFELLAPIVEILGVAFFALMLLGFVVEGFVAPVRGLVDPPIVVLLLTASILFAVFVTLVALLAEEISFRRYRGLPDLFRAMWAAVEENFVYRQVNAWWRLGGIIEVVRRSSHDWGDMQRKGFGPP
ncbi:MAG: glycosyltransferase, partial [Nocardioides sp.]